MKTINISFVVEDDDLDTALNRIEFVLEDVNDLYCADFSYEETERWLYEQYKKYKEHLE